MRSLEFVENREPQGCFGASIEALTGVNQDEVHAILGKSGLYGPDGVTLASDIVYDDAMKAAGLPVRFEEIIGFPGQGVNTGWAFDDSETLIDFRLERLREAHTWDDHEGIVLAYPCERSEEQGPFLHFVAAVEPQEKGAELTVMDPSELHDPVTEERVGGVFHRSEEEVRKMLTPKPWMIPVCAYIVKIDVLPMPGTLLSLVLEAEAGAEIERPLIDGSQTSEPFIL